LPVVLIQCTKQIIFLNQLLIIFGEALVKIPGLDGTGKMGKSEGNAIYLVDEPKAIREKVMKAVSDSGPTQENQEMSEPVKNLFTLMNVISEADTFKFFIEKYNSCTIRYGDMKKQLAEDIKPLDLPIQLNRSAHNSFVGTIFPFKIDQDLTTRIRQLAKDRHLTLFMVLLTAFFTLLHRYSRQEVISLRSLTVGRSRADFEKIIGFFANPIILRADFSRHPKFKDILNQVRQTVSKAIEHQDFPFELLMEKLRFGRDSSANPNPEVMFILQTPQRFISVRRAKNQLSQTGVFTPGKTGIRIDLGGLVVEKCNPKPGLL